LRGRLREGGERVIYGNEKGERNWGISVVARENRGRASHRERERRARVEEGDPIE
jgi:hypothetical protein